MLDIQGIALLKERRSVRAYTDDIVSKDVLRQIMDVARYAPSWANYQIARYTFITNEEKIARLITDGVRDFTYNMKTLTTAKNVLVLSVVMGKSGKLDLTKDAFATSKDSVWEEFDAGIACQTFCLAAHAHGVSTCIMGVIDDLELAKIAELPAGERVAALIVYGYADGEASVPPRLDVDDIIRFHD